MVYAASIAAALLFAIGAVAQQRTAATAPPDAVLSPRLLGFLVRRPLWLVGVGTAAVGNVFSATALGLGTVALVQPLLSTRLVFALAIAAAWARRRVPRRDLASGLVTLLGLGAFVVAARPQDASSAPSSWHWVWAAIAAVVVVGIGVAVSRVVPAAPAAGALAACGAVLFALQSGLTHTAVANLSDGGIPAVLGSWATYAVVVTAVGGTLLVQSAYEMAPLTASYPVLAAVEPLAGIGVGLGVTGAVVRSGPVVLVVEGAGLAVLTAGLLVLARSPVITSQLDVMRTRRAEGEAEHRARALRQRLDEIEAQVRSTRGAAVAGRPPVVGDARRRLERLSAQVDDVEALRDEVAAELDLLHDGRSHGARPNVTHVLEEHGRRVEVLASTLERRRREVSRLLADGAAPD